MDEHLQFPSAATQGQSPAGEQFGQPPSAELLAALPNQEVAADPEHLVANAASFVEGLRQDTQAKNPTLSVGKQEAIVDGGVANLVETADGVHELPADVVGILAAASAPESTEDPHTVEALAHEDPPMLAQAVELTLEGGFPKEAVEEVVSDIVAAQHRQRTGSTESVLSEPNPNDAGVTASKELESPASITEIAANWTWGENGIQRIVPPEPNFTLEIHNYLTGEQPLDEELASSLAAAEESFELSKIERASEISRQIIALEESRTGAPGDDNRITYIRGQLENSLKTNNNTHFMGKASVIEGVLQQRHEASIVVVDEAMVAKEKALLERAIDDRIAANKYPWTLEATTIPDNIRASMKAWHEIITTKGEEPAKDDVFHVPFTNTNARAPEDSILLENSSISGDKTDLSREELTKAGVFFINRVGDGEQPIFGAPIEDEQGVFNVQERSFLTRDELERVYRYQKAHGFGVGNEHDVADVQTDIITMALQPGYSRHGAIMAPGAGRENKYRTMRSPFVESGFTVANSKFGVIVYDTDGSIFGEIDPGSSEPRPTQRRINTLSVHLMGAHPDFPGLSEMPGEDSDWDQKYMSPGEFVEKLYIPPSNKRQIFDCIKNNFKTRREREWIEEAPDFADVA